MVEILPTVAQLLLGISSILVMAGVIGCFYLFMKEFLHLFAECPGFQHLKHRLLSMYFCCSLGVSLSRWMASTSMVFGSLFFSWKVRKGFPWPLAMSFIFSHTCLKWRAWVYHFSTVVGMVSIEYILFMIWVGIPLKKKLMSVSSFFISLSAALFLNFEINLRRGILSEVLAVDSHAMAWSLVFSRIKQLLNLVRKLFHDPKLWGFLLRAVSVSVRAQSPADPLVIKDSTYATFLSSWSYTTLFTRRCNCALLIQALAFVGSPSNAEGCPSFSSWGLVIGAVVVDATTEVVGWLLMMKGFLVWGMGLIGVWGLMWRKRSNSSMRFLGSDTSLEYSVLEVYWDLDSWSKVGGDESMLGFLVFHPLGLACSFVTLWLKV